MSPGTLADVAQLAGVSRSTASRVLSSAGYASPEAVAKVREAAKALGYTTNNVARNLRVGRTRTIGLIVEDVTNSFYAQLVRGVEEVGRQRGFQTVLVNTDGDLRQEAEALRLLQETQVEGVIATPSHAGSARLYKRLIERNLPLIQLDMEAYQSPMSVSVVCDNFGAARRAVEHLIVNGHREIAVFVDMPHMISVQQRIDGYKAALSQSRVAADESLMFVFSDRSSAPAAIIEELRGGRKRFTAAFATTNTVAAALLQAMPELSLSCPDDISVVAFDDAPWMSFFPTPITAVHQPAVEMGRLAAGLLLDQLFGRRPHGPGRVTVEGELLCRRSVRRIHEERGAESV